jgi:PIN domain nuclease of toxin-antitoxin system
MRILLDTHAFLWYITDDEQLSERAEAVISNGSKDVLLSVGSLWEIAIKHGLGKLSLERPFGELMPAQLSENNIGTLPITLSHLAGYVALPLHHRDPFDRLIIAQAQSEAFPVVG